MKRITKILMIGLLAWVGVIGGIVAFAADAQAYTIGSWEYENCLNTSGGRRDISSVQWACSKTDGGWNYACSLWLGSSSGTSTRIYVNEGQSTAYAYYYGMCTENHSTSAVNVYAIYDNYSIGGADSIYRGPWGSPGYAQTTVDVNRFISGVTPSETAYGKEYTRIISINRCNAENSSSCSDQSATVTIIVQQTNYTLYIDQGTGTSISVTRGGVALSNGSTIRPGDQLYITFSKNGCYSWSEHSVNGSPWTSGYTYTVSGDTTVRTRANLLRYTLTKSQGTGTSVSVTKNGSELSNGATIYCGDTLNTSFGLNTGYSWGTHNFTGSGINDSTSLTIRNHTVGANVSASATAVKNTFQGRARVDSGTSIGTSPSSTDYKSVDGSVTKNIDCANSGCNAIFDLYLKTTSGSGNTTFTVRRKKNSGNWTNVTTSPLSPTAPATTGTAINKASGNYQESLTPGEDVCYRITFVPDGTATSTTATETACAHANVSTFEGKVDISGAAAGGTGWKNSDHKITKDVPCTADGCTVTFAHNLKRTAGIGSTDYAITRTSNHPSVSGGAVASGTFSASEQQVKTDTVTLKPGIVVCETITFKPNNNTVTAANNINVTACASASGNAQSGNGGDNTLLDIKVKNNSVNNTYKNYQGLVYAKPGDTVTYRAIYNPILQYAWNITGIAAKYPSWKNGFAIIGTSPMTTALNYGYSNGDTSIRTVYSHGENGYSITTSHVGKTLTETARTNPDGSYYNNIKTTPKQVTFVTNEAGHTNTATWDSNPIISSAEVRVPYNFETTVDVDEPSDDTVDAGGEGTISYEIDVENRCNAATDGCYATPVDNPQSKIISYIINRETVDPGAASVSGNTLCDAYYRATYGGGISYCNEQSVSAGTRLMPGKNPTTGKYQGSFNVPDYPAGTTFCVAAATYPASSGWDTNLSVSGSNTWRISESKCYTIAKKPTFQVWGGNLYSIGSVATYSMTKLLNNQKIVFSSWTERDVTTMGGVKELSSGAATGLTTNNVAGGGVVKGGGYCANRVPLSIANYGGTALPICTRVLATGLSGVMANALDIDELIGDVTEYSGNAIGGKTLAAGETYIIYKNGDLEINGDITYPNTTYGEMGELPKAIIYATGNININCGVGEIDAVLIADRTINTCADARANDPDDEVRSNQLVINGAVIANKLELGRTFGAHTGAYTKIPAEIINYDMSILLWLRNRNSNSNYGQLSQVYQHELAPRY